MWRDYADIIDKLGKPLWYDDNGCPRYEFFKPEMLGVYDDIAVYFRLKCQACDFTEDVVVSSDKMQRYDRFKDKWFTPEEAIEWYKTPHYGDPPIHYCTGDTMNSEAIEILQFWIKPTGKFGWERLKEFEGKIKTLDSETG